MLLVDLVWASLGGFVGAMIRYEVEVAISEKTKAMFPVGAFVVNIIGCFIAGGLIPLGSDKLMKFFGPFLSVGLCGALTTFGTYVLDVLKSGVINDDVKAKLTAAARDITSKYSV